MATQSYVLLNLEIVACFSKLDNYLADEDTEYLDGWGNSLVLSFPLVAEHHQSADKYSLSAFDIEVISAGPDGVLWTNDDVYMGYKYPIFGRQE
ncbi:MAG: hypothetical protein KDB07_06015 [Planctomycetes bacterium]|nr:hypothetical protein [Planctomycetota bacterium]